ncbi:MAG: hypothetical protein IRY91_05895, partial [Gemmatimonadaceae bacterium]|nr:hypothetical protein [Gemmatimonadaceae bacterium]
MAEEPGIPWGRYLAAIRRYKWMILAVVVAGTAAGFGLTRFLTPEYQVQGTLWISDNRAQNRGPVQGEQLLGNGAWADLLKSSTIMERVVRRMALYLWPAAPSDSAVFAGFEPGPGFRAGSYQLRIDSAGAKYTLATQEGTVVERGAVGDSIGRSVGFLWAPAPATLGRGRTIDFTVANPHVVAAGLLNRIDVSLPERSSFLKVTLTGRSARRTAAILNAVMTEFVATAGDLKRRNLTETSKTLEQQLDSAREALRNSEAALQSFRTTTITLPGEGMATAPTPGGADGGVGGDVGNPMVGNYFGQKLQLEAIQHDREALEALLRNPSGISADAFMTIQSARQAPDLQAALGELAKREAQLRTAREIYTDQHPTVQNLIASVQVMRTQTIPQILRG